MARKRNSKTRAPTPEKIPDPRPQIWDRSWFPALLLALISLVYFSEFVSSDKIVFGIDVGTDYHLGLEPISEKIKGLAPPVWNAKMGGYPQSEEIRHHYFPTHLISLFASYHRHIGWRYILTVFLAGWAMYGYLRELQIRRWAAVWAGVAYMSAPTFLAFTYAGHYAKMGVIALFPLMCFLLERGVNRGRPIYFVGLGVLIALGIYSPHLQMLYHALWGLGFYFLFKMVEFYRAGRDPGQMLGRTGLFGLAVVLGLGLGAEGLLPPYLYTKTESKRAAGEEGGAGKSSQEQLEFARSWSLHPEEVASLIVPEFGGFDYPPGGRYYWGRNPMKLNSEYFGILVLLLALLLVPEMKQRPFALFMGLLFAFILAYALGPHTPVHWIFYHLLPGVKVLRTPGMIAFLFAFPACVLAGLGLDRVLRSAAEEGEILGRRLLITGGILTGMALLLALAPKAFTDGWISVFYPDIVSQKRQILADGYGWLARGALCVALVAGAGTILLYLRIRQQLGTGLLLVGLGALSLFDTWRIDRLFLQYEEPSQQVDIRRENPRTVEFLKRDSELFRTFPLPDFNVLKQANYHLYGVTTVTGFHDFTPRRYHRILEELNPVERLLDAKYYRRQQIPYADEKLLETIHPLLNLLNAKYILAPGGIELNSDRFPEVFAAENFRIYENPAVLPWFYLAPSYQVVQGEKQVIAQLLDHNFDPRQKVVLEQEPPAEFAAAPPGDTARDQVEQLDYDLPGGYIRLKTSSSGSRILVVSENFHPNWRVFVDGIEAEMYRANYVWKAAYLPPGDHLVEWRHESRTVRISRWIMLLSLVGILVLVAWDFKVRRPASEH